MQISFIGGNFQFPLNFASGELLMELFQEGNALLATIKRSTPHSVFLMVDNREFELPLAKLTKEQQAELTLGSLVRLEILPDRTLLMTKMMESRLQGQTQEVPLIETSLEEALVQLNIPATPDTLEVAKALVKGGFPLQEKLVWTLLPWAEKGQLETALLLLQAKFPLIKEMVELVEGLRAREEIKAPIYRIQEELSLELKEALSEPRWENRDKFSTKSQDQEVVRRLVKLVVEEQFVETLVNRQALGKEYVFALPFLLNDDLYTSWVRISPEQQSKEGALTEKGFRIDLEIPTASFGLVEGELVVWGKRLRLALWLEDGGSEFMGEELPALERELLSRGWEPSSLVIRQGPRKGGFGDAKSSCLTL